MGKEGAKEWLCSSLLFSLPFSSPLCFGLLTIPSELESEPEHPFSVFPNKPGFSEAFCCVDLRFGYLAWALSALVDFLEVEMVESQFFQR